ncbi:MAG: class I SAM-dependent methyltransferase [Bryobacteraceae bacterium]|nr:class I SAM-dependent methyltransferase [Bryobacteraceae bacterium]
MANGWEESARAWMADQGEQGDFGRKYVLDPVMLPRALARRPRRVLDVGCGEGRFCRMLKAAGVEATTGIDPTGALLDAARTKDPEGEYVEGRAERMGFDDGTFDLVVSYLSLIDIPDARAAMKEMARVLAPGGALLIANLNGFNTAGAEQGWVKNGSGQKQHYPVDRYLEERSFWVEWRGIRIVNHHRPLKVYFEGLLGAGLRLTYFDEPGASEAAGPARVAQYGRAPWFLVMEWEKPGGEIQFSR